jgi:hypothetical protein
VYLLISVRKYRIKEALIAPMTGNAVGEAACCRSQRLAVVSGWQLSVADKRVFRPPVGGHDVYTNILL